MVSRQRRLDSSTLALSTLQYLFTALHSRVKRDPADALDLAYAVNLRIISVFAHLARAASAGAEVHAACQLPHDQQVDPFGGDIRAQGRGARPSSFCSLAGRRLAYRPSSLRMPSSARSGLRCPGRVSHLGPPTAPSSTLSLARQAFRLSSGRGAPHASMAHPPQRAPYQSGTRARTSPPRLSAPRTAPPTISGPMPSPGTSTMW